MVPFTKESPFHEHFKRTFDKMMSYGVLKKIWDDHQKILDLQCEERKVIIVQIVVIYVVAED